MARPKGTCSVTGCGRTHRALGYCDPHLYRLHKFGDPVGGRPIRIIGDDVARLMGYFRVDRTSGCWVWTASRLPAGYGQINWGGTMRRAHRVMYEHLVGPIPKGLELDHLCRNPPCVNPAHLEPVTHRENMLRSDTPSARNARMTSCMRGHEFTSENTMIRKSGKRLCRICCRAYQRERYHQLVTRRT